jgi:hypothetical protein
MVLYKQRQYLDKLITGTTQTEINDYSDEFYNILPHKLDHKKSIANKRIIYEK